MLASQSLSCYSPSRSQELMFPQGMPHNLVCSWTGMCLECTSGRCHHCRAWGGHPHRSSRCTQPCKQGKQEDWMSEPKSNQAVTENALLWFLQLRDCCIHPTPRFTAYLRIFPASPLEKTQLVSTHVVTNFFVISAIALKHLTAVSGMLLTYHTGTACNLQKVTLASICAAVAIYSHP